MSLSIKGLNYDTQYCQYAEFHVFCNAEFHVFCNAECHVFCNAECHVLCYAECHSPECCVALIRTRLLS